VLSNVGVLTGSLTHIPTVLEMPNLSRSSWNRFNWFVEEGLREFSEEISLITDHYRKMEFFHFPEPRFDPQWSRMPK